MRPLLIFLTALLVYALLTLPFLASPFIYIYSIVLALEYGWIAFVVFAIGFYIIVRVVSDPSNVILLLSVLVVISVAIAFHVLGEYNKELDAWNSGGCLVFPVLAVAAGIGSIFISRDKILAIVNSYHKQKSNQ